MVGWSLTQTQQTATTTESQGDQVSVATATPQGVAAQNISAPFRAIVSEIGSQFFERSVEIEALACTMLAKQHGFILGPPGTGKSAMVEELCQRIHGARYWDILMDRQLGKEESFGPTDIALYEQTAKNGNKGIWQRDVEGTLVDSHIVFVDEVGKAGPASLNPYLRAFNERKFRNGKTVLDLPLVSAFGASNEYLETELAAMWDRFLVRLRVDYIQEPGHFAQLLSSAVTRPAATTPTTVDLTDFLYAVDYGVPAVKLPPGLIDSVVQLRSDLRVEEITPSDRRWKQAVRLLQASAYLAGRNAVDDDDLTILQHVLWDVEAQIPTVQKKVFALTSEVTRDALLLQTQLEEIVGGVESRKGQSKDKRAEYGGEAQYKVSEIRKRINDLTEKANREGRSTTRLEGLVAQTKIVKEKIFTECLNVPEDRAKRMAEKD
jgi:MoxR-like ATPase